MRNLNKRKLEVRENLIMTKTCKIVFRLNILIFIGLYVFVIVCAINKSNNIASFIQFLADQTAVNFLVNTIMLAIVVSRAGKNFLTLSFNIFVLVFSMISMYFLFSA